ARFAALASDDLASILDGGAYEPPFAGRLARITQDGVIAVPIEAAPAPDAYGGIRGAPGPGPAETAKPVFFGVYFTPRETFVGSFVTARDERYNLQEGRPPADAQSAHD